MVKRYIKATSKLKIIRIKKRDGIKSKETRPEWEAHNVCKACIGITVANMCT